MKEGHSPHQPRSLNELIGVTGRIAPVQDRVRSLRSIVLDLLTCFILNGSNYLLKKLLRVVDIMSTIV